MLHQTQSHSLSWLTPAFCCAHVTPANCCTHFKCCVPFSRRLRCLVCYAACYGRTRAKGDRAPYPGDAALVLMQATFICLWWLGDVNQALVLLTSDCSKGLGTCFDVAAAEQRTVELNSWLQEGVASVSKSCGAYIFVDGWLMQSGQP